MDLSIEVDQDDDTHVCLKCHTTIIGLDNYVAHRKNVQCKRLNTHKTSEINIEPLASPGNSEYPLRADDFFSSLELQSSAKLTSSSTTPRASVGAGILTRSKTNAAILASGAATAATVSNRDDKESSWIGGHSLKISGADNQSKLIKAVDSLSGNVQKKEDTRYQFDLLNEYNKEGEVSNDEFEEMDEESEEDEDVPPRSHTGGKWKPRNSPIQWMHHTPEEHHRSTEWRSSSPPPPTHTGGKWKPTLTTSTTNVRDDPEDEEDEIPPPNHTKGKWVPGKRNETVKSSSSHNSSIPPTNYTKGKWIPSSGEPRKVTNEVSLLRKSAGTVQYSCGPCNRTLASKFIYDRHLKSDLHKKRMLLETDFEDMEPVQSTSTTTINLRKRKKKPDPIEEPVSKRNKRRISYKCDVCHLKVQSHLIGKHLISHYHWRKSKQTPQIATQMVLDNIEYITYQSPFQCNLCKFYCNTETGFLRHWQSKMHATMNSKDKNGYFWCTYCEFKCNTSNEMGTHLHSKSHKEVVCAINRSVPIVIYKRSRLYCTNCVKEFRYNIELQRHCLKSNCRNVLSNPKCTASNLYQEKYTCQLCSETFRSLISRQRHLKMKHDKMIYLCTKCSMQFTSIEKAKAHRHSSQHRYVSVLKSNKKLKEKSCTFCPQVFENLFTYKTHLMEKHLELVPRCPQCGMKFALPQEVTSHLRLKNCAFITKFPIASSKSYKCKKCPYRTESQAEFLFHEALHRGPVSTTKNTEKYKCSLCMKLFRKASLRCHIRLHTSERPYVCEKCNIGFVRKSNLDTHMKNIHAEEGNIPVDGIEINITPLENSDDGEVKQYGSTSHQNSDDREVKQFLCATCGKNFSKRYLLQQHVINMHKRTVPCPKDGCSYRTYSVSALKPHLQSHNNQRTFQCDFCSYAANTQNLLQRHLKIHDNIKSHRCPVCPFRARLSSRLRQHMRLHTGEKPFKCPHCPYTTTGLENLRKHVISTKKHPGKYLYECKFCTVQNIQSTSTTNLNTIKPFQCNYAQELRKHLLEKHSDKFNAYAATSFVSGIYDATPDPEQIDNPQPLKTNKKQQSKPQKSFTTTNSTPTTFQIIKSTPTTKIDVFNDIHCTTIPTDTLSSTLYLTSSSTDNQNVITQRHTGSSSTLLASGEIGQEVSHFEIITSGETKDDITYIALPANVNQGWTTIEGKFKWDDSNEESSQAFHGDDVFIQEVETFHEDVPADKQE